MTFMNVAHLEIFFDKEFYKPDDEVLVKTILTAKIDIHVNSFVAKIYGIKEIDTISTVDVYNYKSPDYRMDTLFEEQSVLLENEALNAGEHEYFMTYRLPMMNLNKIKKKGYRPKFFINAHVDIPWAIDLDIRQRFLVLGSHEEFEELKIKVDRQGL